MQFLVAEVKRPEGRGRPGGLQKRPAGDSRLVDGILEVLNANRALFRGQLHDRSFERFDNKKRQELRQVTDSRGTPAGGRQEHVGSPSHRPSLDYDF
jgi:hypothetical protein